MGKAEKKLPSRYEGKHEWKKLYDSKVWRQLRNLHLSRHPLCALCLKEGKTVAGNTVHHIKPHRGDWSLFNDIDNLETLCHKHHSADAQQAEVIGYSGRVQVDGWPADNRHPFNKR